MKPVLYVGNRNYSSWSMRPWLVLTWGGIDFDTEVVSLGGEGYGERKMPSILAFSSAGTVPALRISSEIVITDSLAISEWAGEQVPSLWPAAPELRALARSAACEMHSGFGAMRSKLPCNIRRRAEPRTLADDVRRDVGRIEQLWSSLLERSGGPYLFGAAHTIADAFYTPVATRLRTYAVEVGPVARKYADTLLADPAFQAWEAEGAKETWSMPMWDSA